MSLHYFSPTSRFVLIPPCAWIILGLTSIVQTIIMFISVMLVNLLIQDGKSNYMEGLL